MASLVCGWLDLVSVPEAAAAVHDSRSMSSTDEAHFLNVRSASRVCSQRPPFGHLHAPVINVRVAGFVCVGYPITRAHAIVRGTV